MNYFIQTKNNEPIEKPFDEVYLRTNFKVLDVNNLPKNIEKIKFVFAPQLGAYEKNQTVTYERSSDGVITLIWRCEQMSNQEKIEKQNLIKNIWKSTGYASWVFNEETCSFDAPVKKPEDGKSYIWNEPTTSWILTE